MSDKDQTQNIEQLHEQIFEEGAKLAQKLPLLGHVAWLYTQSKQHRHFFLQDLESRVLPAIVTEQCKLYLNPKGTNLPLAYVSWAKMSARAQDNFMATQRIAPNDWKSGDEIWLVDLITPFGGGNDVIADLNDKIFPDEDVYMLYPDADGKIAKRKIREIIKQNQAAQKMQKADKGTKH